MIVRSIIDTNLQLSHTWSAIANRWEDLVFEQLYVDSSSHIHVLNDHGPGGSILRVALCRSDANDGPDPEFTIKMALSVEIVPWPSHGSQKHDLSDVALVRRGAVGKSLVRGKVVPRGGAVEVEPFFVQVDDIVHHFEVVGSCT